jgi:hypothetical protein
MSLLADLGLKPADVNLDDVEKGMAGGSLPPEGVHHAVLLTAGPIPNADGRGWKFEFEIVAGPGKGAVIEEALWKPKGDDPKKDAVTQRRVLLFGHRLGLLKKVKGAGGKDETVEVEGKHDFCDCLGTTCFIKIKHEEEKYEKNGVEKKIKKAKLEFAGLLAPDDKEVKGVPVASGNAAAAAALAGKAGAAAAAAAAQAVNDL